MSVAGWNAHTVKNMCCGRGADTQRIRPARHTRNSTCQISRKMVLLDLCRVYHIWGGLLWTKVYSAFHPSGSVNEYQLDLNCLKRRYAQEPSEATCHSFIIPDLWPPNSHDLNPIDYKICGIIQQRVELTKLQDVNLRLHLDNVVSCTGIQHYWRCHWPAAQASPGFHLSH